MPHRIALILALQILLVAAAAGLVLSDRIPLGVPGEWTWARIPGAPQPGWMPLGIPVVGLFAAFAWRGYRALQATSRRNEVAWVGGLAIAAICVQVAILTAAPEGYGLIKWATLRLPGSSGYLTIAERDVSSVGRFWKDYPLWIRHQDALHIGTHPPGLIVGSRWVFDLVESHPSTSNTMAELLPAELDRGLRAILGPLPKAERATIAAIGLATLLACALTVVPVYVLARSRLDASEAWAAACLWPVVPSAILFQPTADCAFPFLSTSAVALASLSCRGRNSLAYVSGLLLAVGMQFSLVFLPVGLIVAIVLAWETGARVRRVLWTGAGFLGLTGSLWLATGANPFSIWWTNSRNHARFYDQFPRSYLAWIGVDLAEFAVAIGLPAMVWMLFAWPRRRDLAASLATVGVLLLLNFSGKNLSEVARLWLPFMPMLLVAAGAGMTSAGGGARSLAATVVLMGLETLLLQTTLQVVYPV